MVKNRKIITTTLYCYTLAAAGPPVLAISLSDRHLPQYRPGNILVFGEGLVERISSYVPGVICSYSKESGREWLPLAMKERPLTREQWAKERFFSLYSMMLKQLGSLTLRLTFLDNTNLKSRLSIFLFFLLEFC